MWKLKFWAETPQHEKQQQLQKFFCAYLRELEKNWFNCLLSLNKYIFKSLCVECASFCYFRGIFRLCFAKWRVFNRLILRQKVTLRIVDGGAEVFNSLSIKVSRLCSHRIRDSDLRFFSELKHSIDLHW